MNMDYKTAFERLLNHANLPFGLARAPDDESYLYHLWHAGHEKIFSSSIAEAYDNIIICLEVINEELNGPMPSESTEQKVSEIDRTLAYAMQVIIIGGWRYYIEWNKNQIFGQSVLNEVAHFNWGIGWAWEGVLAGDVDSIQEHVTMERLGFT